ncbi:MAG TPA: hypothetical protein VFW34_09650 [Candidatus Rubrimentiphilum sp.]|nr:hypothetical protein [Candidatus Rubrimentiphilum sp.]
MSRRYSTADLMAAIIDLSEATAHGFTAMRAEMDRRFEAADRRFESLEYKMNKRFDSMDTRFDAFERRPHILES